MGGCMSGGVATCWKQACMLGVHEIAHMGANVHVFMRNYIHLYIYKIQSNLLGISSKGTLILYFSSEIRTYVHTDSSGQQYM